MRRPWPRGCRRDDERGQLAALTVIAAALIVGTIVYGVVRLYA